MTGSEPVQCEMCGAETSTPRTAKIEGAELQVCDECADFGTEMDQGGDAGTTTKYSTGESGSTSETASGSQSSESTAGGSGGQSRRDMFDDMDEVVADYDERIRGARESAGLSQAELGDQLNEKASLIRKLERGEALPSDDFRKKLERALDIELLEGGGTDGDAEWSGGDAESGMTLGDVVKRKD
jgi:putative transcription factor